MNEAVHAISCWKYNGSNASELRMVNYEGTGEFLSYQPMWTTVSTNVPELAAGEELIKIRTGLECGVPGRTP